MGVIFDDRIRVPYYQCSSSTKKKVPGNSFYLFIGPSCGVSVDVIGPFRFGAADERVIVSS